MRTLVLAEFFLPAIGGSITWLLNTYSRYDPAEVLFAAPRGVNTDYADQGLPFRVARIPLAMPHWDPLIPRSMYKYLRALWHVYALCRRERVTQIHCAKVLPEGCVAWGMQQLTSIPYIVYAHGEEILIGMTSRKLAWLLPKIYNGAAAIIANSRNTKTLLESIGVESAKIHIVHPGVNSELFNVTAEAVACLKKHHQVEQAQLLLTVGRLQRRKGHDIVIQALPAILQQVANLRYLIVGLGEEQQYLAQMAHEYGVADRVIFAGQVTDEELAAYYAACDVFIMANRQIGPDIEGFGMVYLEAGAACKPVIGGVSGGTDDAIVDQVTGLRVDGSSVKAVTEAVVTLCTDQETARAMGAAGRRRVEQEFTWASVVQKIRGIATRL